MRNGGLKFGLKSFTRGLHANRLLIRPNLSVFLFPGLLGGKFLESVADWRVRTGRVFLAGESRIIVALKSFFNDVEYKWSVEDLQRIQFTCFFDVQLLLGKDRISLNFLVSSKWNFLSTSYMIKKSRSLALFTEALWLSWV